MKTDLAKNLLLENKIDGLLITNPVNIYYLTGFKGVSETEREALLVLRKPKNILITAKLYQAEAKKVTSNDLVAKIAGERNEYEQFIKDAFKGLDKLGFESHDLKFAEYKKFRKYGKGLKLTPTKEIIENLRLIKSEQGIKNIKNAQLLTQKAFYKILPLVKVGQTEDEIAGKLINIMKSLGAQGPSFEPIIASGPNSALPHHKTGKRRIKRGDTLLFDFGAKYKNYCADFSRTVFIGNASDKQRKTYGLVFKAQQLAIKKAKSGMAAKKLFSISHKVFKEESVDNHFIHSLGHGIGLEVHEKPSISAKSKDIISEKMVFTIEPGLYFNWGGVRIEDIVEIKNGSAKPIGKASTFLEIQQ